jgi:hypothetical protein
VSLATLSGSQVELIIFKGTAPQRRGNMTLWQTLLGERQGICRSSCSTFFLTVSSAPSSHGEDVQVKQRRIRPTKRLPAQAARSDIEGPPIDQNGQQVMVSATRLVTLLSPSHCGHG